MTEMADTWWQVYNLIHFNQSGIVRYSIISLFLKVYVKSFSVANSRATFTKRSSFSSPLFTPQSHQFKNCLLGSKKLGLLLTNHFFFIPLTLATGFGFMALSLRTHANNGSIVTKIIHSLTLVVIHKPRCATMNMLGWHEQCVCPLIASESFYPNARMFL